MKKVIFIMLTALLPIVLLVGCGNNKKNEKVTGWNTDWNHNNNYNNHICDRIHPNDFDWIDPHTGIVYRRDGSYLVESRNSGVRIDCSRRFHGQGKSCENTYYENNGFYRHDTGNPVNNCNLRDHYYRVPQNYSCPLGYISYHGIGVDGLPYYFCLNGYMFSNWGQQTPWDHSMSYQLPTWLSVGFLLGFSLGGL